MLSSCRRRYAQSVPRQPRPRSPALRRVGESRVSPDLLEELTPHLKNPRIDFTGATFTGDATFTNVIFCGYTRFIAATFVEYADFARTAFTGSVNFSMAKFGGPAKFLHASFGGPDADDTMFDRATFTDDAIFSSATFSPSVTFNKATFERDAYFFGAEFMDYARFHETTFSGDAYFRGARFGVARESPEAVYAGDTDLGPVRSTDDANFGKAVFTGDANFDQVTATGEIGFDGATFGDLLSFCIEGSEPSSVVDLTDARFNTTARIAIGRPLALPDVVIQAPVTIVAGGRGGEIVSLERATLEAPLVVGGGVQLRRCRLSGATGLDRLRIVNTSPGWARYERVPYGPWRSRQVLADEVHLRAAKGQKTALSVAARHQINIESAAPPAQIVEASYRQLRAALEASKAAPAANNFYYGEMEMRRLGTERLTVEWPFLLLYKATCGYGLRAWRAIASYAVILLAVTALFSSQTSWFVNDRIAAAGGPSLAPGVAPPRVLDIRNFWDAAAILARSSVSFLSPVTNGLTAWGTLALILLRFAAPTFLALAVLAVRARVQR